VTCSLDAEARAPALECQEILRMEVGNSSVDPHTSPNPTTGSFSGHPQKSRQPGIMGAEGGSCVGNSIGKQMLSSIVGSFLSGCSQRGRGPFLLIASPSPISPRWTPMIICKPPEPLGPGVSTSTARHAGILRMLYSPRLAKEDPTHGVSYFYVLCLKRSIFVCEMASPRPTRP